MTHLELPEEMDDRPEPFSSVNNCGDDYDDEEDGLPKIRIGICAMSKKNKLSAYARDSRTNVCV